MKKSVFLLLLSAFFVSSYATIPVPPKKDNDNKYLIHLLVQTRDSVLQAVNGLSDAQLTYKPAPDRWSVIECVEHIMKTEKIFWNMEQQAVNQPANPEKRKDIKVTDEMIEKGVEDRSHKAKAPDMLVPTHEYSSNAALIKAFTDQRNQLISYLENTKDNLRDHVTELPVFGTADAYQILLMDAAHTNRHTQQLREVMASPGFPK
ncbi:DinB family protein [Chitinophaga silvatica]|uniref:DinB family protein n=1 Tax=Chitinophaga silvatica TaxID=2282649 RepID=A0A3E1YE93_9BACT|nr:DinB family protein [Chitinophaga silvatica]RFS24821.1 DinB family protein [Chitinophaga silvatica]